MDGMSYYVYGVTEGKITSLGLLAGREDAITLAKAHKDDFTTVFTSYRVDGESIVVRAYNNGEVVL